MVRERGTARHESAELIRTIGDRLRQARELSNLSQQAAAKLLGYQNSSKLSKIERSTNSRTVPLWLIMRASKLYEVSTDFLFGLSEDWDTGVRMTRERETSAWLFDQWEKSRERDMRTIRMLNDRLETIDGAIATTIGQVFEIEDGFNKFAHLNEKAFMEMRGGARLKSAIEKGVAAASESRARMKRFHMDCKAVGKECKGQMNLFVEEDDTDGACI